MQANCKNKSETSLKLLNDIPGICFMYNILLNVAEQTRDPILINFIP